MALLPVASEAAEVLGRELDDEPAHCSAAADDAGGDDRNCTATPPELARYLWDLVPFERTGVWAGPFAGDLQSGPLVVV